MNTLLPTTRLGRTGMLLTRVGSAPGPSAAATGPSPGATRTTRRRSRRSGTRSSPGSTGSTPPPSTGSATPRRSSRRRWPTCPRHRPYVFTKGGLVWDPAAVGRPPAGGRPGQPAGRGRGVAAAPAGRPDRPVPDALAGRGRHPGRGVLAGVHRPQARGQDPRGRAVQPQRVPARGGRGGRRGGRHPAAVQPDPPRRGRRRPALGARARRGRDRLQPDGLGPAHRLVHRRAGGPPAAGRLAGRAPRLPSRPCRPTWPWPTRCARSPDGTASPRPRWPSPGRWRSPG